MRSSTSKTLTRVAVAAMAMCMAATTAFAAAIDHYGPGKLFHMPDGKAIPRAPLTDEQRAVYLSWESQLYGMDMQYTGNNEIGTINVAVGETVVIHAAQLMMGWDDTAGPRGLYRKYDSDTPHTSIETVVKKDFDDLTHSDMFYAKDPSARVGGDYYCLEWAITGAHAGIDYLWYQESPFEAEYIRVVVGGTASSSSSGSSSSNSTSSGGSASGSASTSGSSSGGASSGSASTSGSSSNGTSAAMTVTTTAEGAVYGVQVGDTLANIAMNFYGDYRLWPELQRINQQNLNSTADGLIFPGFGLILPDTLAGVSRMEPPTAGSGETLYTVKAGDTLGTIAAAHYGDFSRYESIYARNSGRMANVNTIYEGQVIVLP